MSNDTCNKKLHENANFEDALDLTGFGKYNMFMLGTCCLLILGMYIDMFGFSVMMPTVACDMRLTTSQLAVLTAMPLIGVVFSSYAWGLCADTLGRRTSLLLAMPIGMLLNVAASLAPTYASLATLKFLSACFTSSANAAGFVLLAESAPEKYRSKCMFLMASATVFTQFILCVMAMPVLTGMSFKYHISFLALDFRPWRLLMLIICSPGILGTLALLFLHESPKFLLSIGNNGGAMDVLKTIYRINTGSAAHTYPVNSVAVEILLSSDTSIVSKIWNQTAPLFQRPLVYHNLKLYFILLCVFVTSSGYFMWVTTITNAYFSGADSNGMTFCDVVRASVSTKNTTITECDNAVSQSTLLAVMLYSGISGVLNILLTFVVVPLGKRRTSICIFAISTTCGVVLLFVTVPLISLALFFCFLYVILVLGNANTYLIELNPTHLRGMVTCLSVVVTRAFGFISVHVIGVLLTDHCTPMIAGYSGLLACGFLVTCTLPPDNGIKKTANNSDVIQYEKTAL